jgi:hypothetical protein
MAKIRGIAPSVWALFDKQRGLLNASDYLFKLLTDKPIVTAPTTIVSIDETQLKFKDAEIKDLKAQLAEAALTISKLSKKIKKLAED